MSPSLRRLAQVSQCVCGTHRGSVRTDRQTLVWVQGKGRVRPFSTGLWRGVVSSESAVVRSGTVRAIMGRHAGAVAHLSGHSHRRQHELIFLTIRGRVATDPSPLKR